MAEQQATRRQELEGRVIKNLVRDSSLGLWFAFVIVIGFLRAGGRERA